MQSLDVLQFIRESLPRKFAICTEQWARWTYGDGAGSGEYFWDGKYNRPI